MEYDINSLLWDTTALYPSPDAPELERDLQEAASRTREFRGRYLGNIAAMDAAGFLEALTVYEALQGLVAKPQSYAYLLFAGDSSKDVNKRLSQRAIEFGNLMARELLFFDLEIIQLEDVVFQSLVIDPLLTGYRHYLESIRRFRPHTLPEREETLLKRKTLTGVDAFTRLFDELSSSFTYSFEVDGEVRQFTGDELLGLLHHPDAGVRERAFSLFLKRHEENEIVYGAVFNNIALDHGQELELRNYQSPMEPTNLGNELPSEVVERLMQVSEENYPLARDYVRLTARLLNLSRLKNTDIYAPVSETSRR